MIDTIMSPNTCMGTSCFHSNSLDEFPLLLQSGGKHKELLLQVFTELADLVLYLFKHWVWREETNVRVCVCEYVVVWYVSARQP